MLSDQSSSTLRDYILHHFPTTAKQFHCSLSSALLLRLSTYFFRLPVSISGFEADHKAVEQALPTLNELVTRFLEAAPASRGYLIDHERSRRVSFLDPALLRNLRCNVPTNREEAHHIADEILQGQRYILEVRVNVYHLLPKEYALITRLEIPTCTSRQAIAKRLQKRLHTTGTPCDRRTSERNFRSCSGSLIHSHRW